MNRYIKFIFTYGLICLIIVLTACSDRPKGVLSPAKMTEVLTEMHKLDGCFDAKGINYTRYDLKSDYYNALLEKYGITQVQFDSSVVWYTENPKEYEDIYIDVIKNLKKLQDDVKKGKYHQIDSLEMRKIRLNLWNKKLFYHFRKDSVRTQLSFKITDNNLLYGDVYKLMFLQRIGKADSCPGQRIVLRINYYNGTSDSLNEPNHNDNYTRRFVFTLPARKKLKIKSLSGELLASKSYKGVFDADIDSISLIRIFDPKMQDSLRKMVQKADPMIYKTPDQLKMDSLMRLRKAVQPVHPVVHPVPPIKNRRSIQKV